MPIPGSPPERLAPLIRLVGIDIVPLEQHPHDPLIPIPSPQERCLAPLICPVGIDIIPLEEYPHNPLMLSLQAAQAIAVRSWEEVGFAPAVR